MLSTDIMQRIILIIIGWIAVVLVYAGRSIASVTDDAVYTAGRPRCFARSSPRFHDWLLYRSWFGGYLRHWQKHRAMPPGAKPRAILLILVTFAISLWLVNMMWVRGLLLVILACLLIFMCGSR